MANTTLFAPQVRAIQPAFVYSLLNLNESPNVNKCKVYFTPSFYSNETEIKTLLYSIIDSNKASAWGDNSIIKKDGHGYDAIPYDPDKIQVDSLTQERYFTLDLGDPSTYKSLIPNQYYQLQIRVSDKELNYLDQGKSLEDWIDENIDSFSNVSQVSLLRPILPFQLNWEISPSHQLLQGSITYNPENSFEVLDQGEIILGSYSKTFNCEGLSFSVNLDFPFIEGEFYTGILKLKTIHGLVITDELKKIFSKESVEDSNDIQVSYIDQDMKVLVSNLINQNYPRLERMEDNSGVWLPCNINGEKNGTWTDFSVEAGKTYSYRISNDNQYVTSTHKKTACVDFEDIFLSDKDAMMAIRYNPNIEEFKYVSQENLTTTIGGKYPIIRRNGHIRYRQFKLSGTVFLDFSDTAKESQDSESKSLSLFFKNESENAFLLASERAFFGERKYIDRQVRDYIISWLSNGSVKLFRSAEEGNMIIYLSGCNFAPNKQLGRSVYDFSATATEICDYSMENLKKYNLIDSQYVAPTFRIKEKMSLPVLIG